MNVSLREEDDLLGLIYANHLGKAVWLQRSNQVGSGSVTIETHTRLFSVTHYGIHTHTYTHAHGRTHTRIYIYIRSYAFVPTIFPLSLHACKLEKVHSALSDTYLTGVIHKTSSIAGHGGVDDPLCINPKHVAADATRFVDLLSLVREALADHLAHVLDDHLTLHEKCEESEQERK
jgi:hypothetical protein